MTFTLAWHWWFGPLLVLILGWLWAAAVEKNSHKGGMFPDPAPVLIALAGIIAAVALTIGHFL